MFALFGSVFYLLGAALLYGAYGTLDIVLLAERMRPLPAVWLAAGLMTAGLLAKTALFPLHLWLPPAHANAPAAASAVLSGLVVKGSFFLTVRLWFYVLPALPGGAAEAVLGTLGSAAILFGSVLALRQERLKLLIAYSTLAQIGYLFLIFPLASGAHPWIADGWSGGMMQTLSHAFAKAAMFLSAGLLAESLGHDRIAEFAGAGRAMPATFFALGLGGLSLMGLPPSGGFAAKWLLLRASVAAGQWPWAIVMLAGGLLAAGYVYRILAPALSDGAIVLKAPPQRSREAIALALAIVAVALGFAPQSFFDFLQIGRAGRDGDASMTARRAPSAHGCSRRRWPSRSSSWRPASRGDLRRAALSLQWLAPVPALAAAILALGGGPFGCRGARAAPEPPARSAGRAPARGRRRCLWIVVSAATFSGEGRKPNERFAVSWLLTLTGSLGVFVAADLLTFYLVYALVSIPAYGLIVAWTTARRRRARAASTWPSRFSARRCC